MQAVLLPAHLIRLPLKKDDNFLRFNMEDFHSCYPIFAVNDKNFDRIHEKLNEKGAILLNSYNDQKFMYLCKKDQYQRAIQSYFQSSSTYQIIPCVSSNQASSSDYRLISTVQNFNQELDALYREGCISAAEYHQWLVSKEDMENLHWTTIVVLPDLHQVMNANCTGFFLECPHHLIFCLGKSHLSISYND